MRNHFDSTHREPVIAPTVDELTSGKVVIHATRPRHPDPMAPSLIVDVVRPSPRKQRGSSVCKYL